MAYLFGEESTQAYLFDRSRSAQHQFETVGAAVIAHYLEQGTQPGRRCSDYENDILYVRAEAQRDLAQAILAVAVEPTGS